MRLLPLLILCAFVGCASVDMYTDSLAPKPEEANIDVYSTKTPDRDYIEIGEITARYGIEQVKRKARKIGADAVIITGKARKVMINVGYGNYVSKEKGIKAVAIKYK